MAILDQSYQPWFGDFQPRYRRIAAMIRVGIKQAFAGSVTKIVVILIFAVMFAWTGILFLLSTARVPLSIALGNAMYQHFLGDVMPVGVFVMTLAALVGGRAIARDLRSNAVAMYFSKAISRTDYILGKAGTVGGLLLSTTLLPGLCLWVGHWAISRDVLTTGERLSDLLGIVKQSLVLVVPMTMYVLALSSLSRNAFVPGILWVLTYLGSSMVAVILGETAQREWCKLVSWPNLVARLGELSYQVRPLKSPAGFEIVSSVPTMAYGWREPLAILAAVTALSVVVILWRLRKFEGHE